MLYVPTVMLYFVGVSVYVLGPGHQRLADNKIFASSASLALLTLLTVLNILGLGVGKWINNLGAIGTFIAAAVLIGLGIVIWPRFGTDDHRSRLQDSCESEIRAEFFWRDLLRTCRPGTRLGHGRRNPGSATHFARRRRLGRSALRRSVCRSDSDAADRSRQERQRAAGDRAGCHPHGGTRRRRLDHRSHLL